jgi:FkbM family methyltransferase
MAVQNRYKQFYTLGGKFVDATNWTKDMSMDYLHQHYGWEGVMAHGNLIHDDMNVYGPGIQSGDIYVDLGSNIGMSALVAEQRNAAKIYCVEPDIGCYEALAKNRGPNWVLDNIAISDKPGIIQVANWPNSNDLRPVTAITFYQYVNQHCLTVIDFLKVDIEGHEKTVLYSISDETWKKVRKTFIEYHEDNTLSESEKHTERFKFMRLLAEKGFTEYCVFIRHYQSFFYAWK